jgi:HYR domain
VAGEGRAVLAVPGRSDRRLSKALRLHVPREVPPGPGGLLGLELEFSVRSARGSRVHFGSVIHRLALDGTALDPGDPNAYRCWWGGVITSDGAEAEIATPPVRTRPGFAARLQGWARTGEAELRRAVPRGVGLDGYSAHFSAAMPGKLNDRVCRLYAERFAADLMLLMDRADSPGLLVRPRPGRTELCGEFTEDEPLAAAAAFVAGSTRACAAAVRGPGARTALPPRLEVRLARAVHRYGWYVDRGAFGTDLHAASRRALLRRASGGTISAQSHLELAWAAAREALADDAAASDLQAAEAMVTGSLPLPAEHGQPGGAPGGQRGRDVRSPLDGTVVPDTSRLCAQARPGYTLRPVAATWDFTVFEATGPARRAYACIPRDSLPGFAAALEEGALDEAIAAYLALSSHRRVLSAARQTTNPGLYDKMGPPAGLLAPERDPQTGHQDSGNPGAKRTLARPGKQNRQERAAPRRAARPVPKAAAIGAAIALVLAGGGVAAAMLTHQPGKTPGFVSVQPSALSFPAVPVNASVSKSLTVANNRRSQVMVTHIRITGPAQDDFSLGHQGNPVSAHRSGQAVQPAVQPRPLCLRPLQAGRSCNIRVVFTPSAPGPHAVDLEIYFASRSQPQEIALTGTGNPRPGATPSTPGASSSTPGATPSTPGSAPSTPGSTPSTPSTPGSTPSTPPTLKLPPDQTVEATGRDGATVTYPVSASDAQDGTLTPSCGPASGSVFPLGTTTVNCSVTDGGGLTATGSFTVTVQDTTPPSLNLPGNITVHAGKAAAAKYTATATDLVDGSVPVSCSPASGTAFALGATPVECSATDAHGNKATGSFTVTVGLR